MFKRIGGYFDRGGVNPQAGMNPLSCNYPTPPYPRIILRTLIAGVNPHLSLIDFQLDNPPNRNIGGKRYSLEAQFGVVFHLAFECI